MQEVDLSNKEARLLYVLKVTTGQVWQDRLPLSVISTLATEVHVLVLTQGPVVAKSVQRIADNVWVYTICAKHWWWTPSVGLKFLTEQLAFANGFRPSQIIALDPHESAFVAYRAGKKYSCPTQLHILADISAQDFTPIDTPSKWHRLLASYLIPKFKSVRTQTQQLADSVYEYFSTVDLEVLPRYHTRGEILSKKKLNLPHTYRPHEVFVFWSGSLDADSSLYQLLQSLRFVLKSPRVALVVHGQGVAKAALQEQAKVLGIQRQVIFLPPTATREDYLLSVDLLVVNATNFESDELVFQALGAGVPVVMTQTPQRADVFVHGESGFLCPADDIQFIADRVEDLLNDVGLRQQFSTQAKQITDTYFYTDVSQYQQAYWQCLSLHSQLQPGLSDTSQP